ncbi:hypothetical protein [Nitratireductor soli]|uniref:hypothetical protein n=1 Tax=Nitratireductor soli TaxID=1670619 RepID=UPI00065DEEDD|nr:hypothetical protein [Nitratireductor soli]
MTTIIDMPGVLMDDVSFRPFSPVLVDRMEGRRTETLRRPTNWWIASWRTVQLTAEELGRMDAWSTVASDGALFRAFDVRRPRPMAEDTGQPLSGARAGGGAFDGTATIIEIGADRRSVTIGGLPANFQLKASDYVELRMSALLVSLHWAVADVQASAAGVAVLPIRYGIDAAFTTAATVNFEKPACLMQLDPSSYESGMAGTVRQASFSAQEVFPREVP